MNEKENLAAELKKNTVIMNDMLANKNLQILQISYVPCSDEFECEIIVEYASLKGSVLDNDVDLKINLYDASGNIFFTESFFVNCSEFAGYDTKKAYCLYSDALKKAKKARVWAV